MKESIKNLLNQVKSQQMQVTCFNDKVSAKSVLVNRQTYKNLSILIAFVIFEKIATLQKLNLDVADNPAKIIKFRFEPEIIETIIKAKWRDYSYKEAKKRFKSRYL